MEILTTNFWWLLLIVFIIFIFTYKIVTKNPDAITSKFQEQKNIIGNPNDNVKHIENALKNAGFNKVGLNAEENLFYAQTNFSMSSFSEYIEVSFNHDDNSTDLVFKSICSLPTQLIDWGKNKRNYKKFERELEKLMVN